MDGTFIECAEAKGKCIVRLRCYDSATGLREFELQFTDGGVLVWRISSTIEAAGELLSPTSEGLAIGRRYEKSLSAERGGL
jgi:hypothetical protein